MKVRANHRAQWDRTSSQRNQEKHPIPKKTANEKTQVIPPKSAPMKQQGNGPASGQIARLSFQRTPDARFKLQTEGPAALKEQRLEQPRGSRPGTRKPEPSALASQTQDLTPDRYGNPVVARELGGPVNQWQPRTMTLGTPLPASEPESLWHIFIQTLKNPAQMLYQSYAHIGALIFQGRYATEQELDIARKLGIPIDIAAKTLVPAVGYASGVATAIEAAEQWAKEGTIDPQALFDVQTSMGKPDQPGALNTKPSTQPKNNAGAFKPPRRLEDGRVGYLLSPTNPPRLPEASPNAQQHGLSPQPPRTPTSGSASDTPVPGHANSMPLQRDFDPPQRLDDERVGHALSPLGPPRLPGEPFKPSEREVATPPRPGHTGSARADAQAGPSGARARNQQTPPFRPEYSLETVRDPQTGAILRKEFAREEIYKERASSTPDHPQFDVKITTDGYISNYRNKGYDAIVLHGSLSRHRDEPRLMYQRGRDVAVQLRGEKQPYQHQTFDFQREVTAAEYLEYLKRDHQLDLVGPRGGGTGSDGPIYLMTCEATAGGRNSLAQQFSNKTQREVRAYSNYEIRVADANFLEDSQQVPKVGLDHPYPRLVELRNKFRRNSKDPLQLIHKKFQPRATPVPSTPSQATMSNQPIVFQQYPRTPHSPFTSTQPSLATFTDTQPSSGSAPSFTASKPSTSQQSSVLGSQPGGTSHGSSAFFDHPAPPKPPTQFSPTKATSKPQQTPMPSAASGPPPRTETPSSASESDFFNLPSQPPTHPLKFMQAPLAQHAVISGSADSFTTQATGVPSDASTPAPSIEVRPSTHPAGEASPGTVSLPTPAVEPMTWV